MPKALNKYSQKRNGAATVPISTFMCLWAILYSHDRSEGNMWADPVNMLIAHRQMSVENGTVSAQFPEKEYINGIFVAVWFRLVYPRMGLLVFNSFTVWTLVFILEWFPRLVWTVIVCMMLTGPGIPPGWGWGGGGGGWPYGNPPRGFFFFPLLASLVGPPLLSSPHTPLSSIHEGNIEEDDNNCFTSSLN